MNFAFSPEVERFRAEFEHTATNQRGEVVAICRRSGLMHCKPKA